VSQPDFSAAAERNKQPILEVLRQMLPPCGSALEIASGTGQHVAWFATHLPQWRWQPTDAPPASLDGIRARIEQQGLRKVRAPLHLDVLADSWLTEPEHFDLIYNANMLHISSWSTCAALMRGAARYLAPGGRLVTYGPYLEDDVPTSEGNLSFDKSLRAQDPAWGLRRREDVAQEAQGAGLRLAARHAMPANNLLLMWTRADDGGKE